MLNMLMLALAGAGADTALLFAFLVGAYGGKLALEIHRLQSVSRQVRPNSTQRMTATSRTWSRNTSVDRTAPYSIYYLPSCTTGVLSILKKADAPKAPLSPLLPTQRGRP